MTTMQELRMKDGEIARLANADYENKREVERLTSLLEEKERELGKLRASRFSRGTKQEERNVINSAIAIVQNFPGLLPAGHTMSVSLHRSVADLITARHKEGRGGE